MNKNLKILALLVAGVGGYLVVKNLFGKKSKGLDKSTGDKSTNASSDNAGTPSVQKYFPLVKGSKGEKVRELQNALISIDALALPKYGVDGAFGIETETAVFKYLNKKSVDSQEDINKILNTKDTQKAAELVAKTNADRNVLGENLKDAWAKNKSANLYSDNLQAVSMGILDLQGAERNVKVVNVKKGDLLARGKDITEMVVLQHGFVKAILGEGANRTFVKFSPFVTYLR